VKHEEAKQYSHGLFGSLAMWLPEKIISGGQTGADVGGLVGAERCGIPTGGCAPRGYKTENGPQPILQSRFGLVAHPSPHYADRTRENVIKSNAVVVFATRSDSVGTKLTIDLCDKHQKPWCLLDPEGLNVITELQAFIEQTKPKVLNIAGNRESVSPGIAKRVAAIIELAFTADNDQH
jgi:hypothetical protein